MKRIILFFLVSVVFFGIFSFASASKPDITRLSGESGETFIVGSETKSIPDIDRMYAATGATIQSDFHAKAWNKLFKTSTDPTVYSGIQLPTGEVVLYLSLSNSGFSIN